MDIWVGYTDATKETIMEVYGLIEPVSFPFPDYGAVTEADPRYRVWWDFVKSFSPPMMTGDLPEATYVEP